MSRESLATFLRQSGGLTAAIFLGGLASYAVHIFAKEMPKAEYGDFTTLLQLLNLVGIPVIGLQTALAQQAAAAQTETARRQLAAALRIALRFTFIIWLTTTVAALLFQDRLLNALKIINPGPLWITLTCALMALWLPIFSGTLQGQQNFLWLGGSILSLGVVRLVAIAAFILGLGAQATGAMAGVWLGYFAALTLTWWAARSATRDASHEPFLWRPWLKGMVPITIGSGAGLFLMCADMVFVKHHFDPEQTGFYAAAGMIGRALVFLAGPVAMVMFPKVARAAATGEKSAALFQALGVTALVAGVTAGFCTLFPELPLRLVYDASFLRIAPIVPWFVWAMTPLVLAGVLNSHLLARGRYAVVPWLLLVVVAYGIAQNSVAKHAGALEPLAGFSRVVQTLGGFNLLFLAVALFFSWREREQPAPGAA